MSTEKLVLNTFFVSRAAYDKLKDIITDDDLSVEGAILVKLISKFYAKDKQAQQCNKDILCASIERSYPKHSDRLCDIVNSFDTNLSENNSLSEIIEHKKNTVGIKLGSKLLNPNTHATEITQLLDSYHFYNTMSEDDIDQEKIEVLSGVSVKELSTRLNPDHLYKLYPRSLNDAVGGGVPLHTHIGLMGVPESGKTLFSINNACGFARAGETVLYLGNEDPSDQYLIRMISRITGLTKQEIEANPSRADSLARSRGWDNIHFLPDGTFTDVDSLIQEINPRLVILDQIRQIEMPGVEGDADQLTKAAKLARKITKKHDIITMSMTQAGDSAEGKLVLGKGDVYMSNTTFPGDVDILIGWGMNDDFEANNRRMISLPKNKINGNHDHFQVTINPMLSKIIS